MTSTEGSPVEPPATADDDVKKLRRSQENRWIAGVSGGLAEYFGLHPAIYRVLFVALAFAGGTGILLYVAAALVMPAEGRDESPLAETLRRHRDRPWLVIGLALLALAVMFALSDPGPGFGFGPGGLVLLLFVAVGVFVWSRAARRDARRGEASGRRSVRWRAAAVVGITAVLVTGVAGGAIAAASVKGGIGDRVERPVSLSELEREYRLGFGQLELDLRGLELPRGETRVEASVGFGELHVTVPSDVAVAVTADARWGEVDVLGRETDGRHARDRYVDPGFDDASRRLVVEAEVRGPGEISVRR
jgi:phage shock protein PspC (stress-responsive transcriptional regulator)